MSHRIIRFVCRIASLSAGLALVLQAQTGGDAYPYGAIAFFNAKACPTGWTAFTMANGYFVVPTMQNGGVGSTVGAALQSGQDPQHTHTFSSGVTLADQSYIGVDGCCNNTLTSSGTQVFTGTTAAASPNVPYVQLLTCMKKSMPSTGAVPTNEVSFFGSLMCPDGWTQTFTTSGRFPVGLPDGGAPGAAFGGDPLTPREVRMHAHPFSGSVTTTAQGIGLGNGCCGDGYGANGTYTYAGTTDQFAAGLPYIQLLQCQASPSVERRSRHANPSASAH